MELLTAKVKIILFLLVGSAVCFALYRWWHRTRRGAVGGSIPTFTVPADRVRKEVLANGMHVLVFKNTAMPKVLVQIAYDVGSYVEDSGERGLAHLVEHMIFKGTQKLSESDIDAIARKYGATMNAFTSYDVTSYHFEVNKNNWKPFFGMLADCMQNARFDDQHLASEIKAVIQELKMCRDSYWRMMILKACTLLFPSNHPYHTPVIGFKEDLLNLDAENLKRFYKKYYRPDRATLFIVGDVDPEEALASAREQFAHIMPEQASIVKEFPVLIPELTVNHTRSFEDVQHEHLGLYWVIPGHKSETEHIPSAIALLLGEGQSSRLSQLLVDDKKIASSVYVKASKFAEAGIFIILIEPMPGKGDECVDLVKQELARLINDGVVKQELERIAKQKSKRFFLKLQDYHDFVYNWIKSYFATRDELDVFKRITKFHTLTSDQIKAYAQTHLDPFLMSRIEVLPLPESKRPLREAIKQASDQLDQKILSRHVRTAPVEEPRAALTFNHPHPLEFKFPQPTRVFELKNGLKVILARNADTPLIALNCQFKDASFVEESREGISLECMMDMLMEGSDGLSKKDNVDFFEQHGASYSFSAHGARFLCLRDDFDALAQRFYHIIAHPTFPTAALDKLKKIFVSNYQRAQDSPRSMASRILKNAIYKDHPYAWTFDEAIDLINGCDVAALKALHQTFVCPANMTLSVVGDFDEQQMEKAIAKLFGSWPTGEEKKYDKVKHGFDAGATLDHHMLRDQVMLLMGQPSSITIYDEDLVPLKMLSIICFDSMGSRIFKVREQTGLFYTAFGSFATHATKEHGYDYIGMLVSPENMETAEQQMRAVLQQVAQHGVTDEEIDAARQIYLKDLIDLIASDSAIARLMCSLDSFKLGFDYYDKVLARVQTLTRDELNAIAARYCLPDKMVRVRVGPVGKKG